VCVANQLAADLIGGGIIGYDIHNRSLSQQVCNFFLIKKINSLLILGSNLKWEIKQDEGLEVHTIASMTRDPPVYVSVDTAVSYLFVFFCNHTPTQSNVSKGRWYYY
jgi:hypothetical protein